MTLIENVAALRSITKTYITAEGERVGFLMSDAIPALGGMPNASKVFAVFVVKGLLESETVVMNDDVHTLYRLAAVAIPSVH